MSTSIILSRTSENQEKCIHNNVFVSLIYVQVRRFPFDYGVCLTLHYLTTRGVPLILCTYAEANVPYDVTVLHFNVSVYSLVYNYFIRLCMYWNKLIGLFLTYKVSLSRVWAKTYRVYNPSYCLTLLTHLRQLLNVISFIYSHVNGIY